MNKLKMKLEVYCSTRLEAERFAQFCSNNKIKCTIFRGFTVQMSMTATWEKLKSIIYTADQYGHLNISITS